MQKEYRVQVRVRNNLILSRILEKHKSVTEFCRVHDLHVAQVLQLISFKQIPLRDDGSWRDVVWDISSALRCEPEELFTDMQLTLLAEKSTAIKELTEGAFVALTKSVSTVEELSESSERVKLLMNMANLTERQTDIVLRRADDETLEEVSKTWGVSRDRIRQVEAHAIRKLKNAENRLRKQERKEIA